MPYTQRKRSELGRLETWLGAPLLNWSMVL